MIRPVTNSSPLPVKKPTVPSPSKVEPQQAFSAERPSKYFLKDGRPFIEISSVKNSEDFLNMQREGFPSPRRMELAEFAQLHPEQWAEMQKDDADRRWRESPEGAAQIEAERVAQLKMQNAQPVELAVYKGGKLVGLKSEGGGFTSDNSLGGSLPEGWDSMSPQALKRSLEASLGQQYKIRIASDGLAMTTGQAMEIFNRH